MKVKFEYGTARVRDLKAVTSVSEKNGLPKVTDMALNGELFCPTPRFWRSFFGRFRICETTFRYFSHEEVFARVSQRAECERFQYCIERGAKRPGNLLAVTAPHRPLIGYEEVLELVKRHDGENVNYAGGIVTSTHAPTSGDHVVQIGADRFQNRYELQTPIDGYGVPKLHLSLLRLVCTNGAVGYSQAFRNDINIGKNPAYSIARVLDIFDNDNGYAALWQRFESAQNSWASLRETQELYTLLARLEGSRGFRIGGVLKRFYELTGRPHELYGIANLDAFSAKRQRVLPAKCRVYDLLNFASEIATHQSEPNASVQLQAYIGGLVSDEYDMEGTAEKISDFQDFFVSNDKDSPSKN
jgi:hypothetical protein